MNPRIVTWNCWFGQSPSQLRRNLIRLALRANLPHVIVLQEAGRLESAIPAYRLLRPLTGDRSIAFLVRLDVKVLDWDPRTVPNGEWVYGDRAKPARVFAGVRLRSLTRTFDVIGVHQVPLGPEPPKPRNRRPWREGMELLVRWSIELSRNHPYGQQVLVGDWNTYRGKAPAHPASIESVATLIGAKIRMRGIDGFLVVRDGESSVRTFGDRFGSDTHRPVALTLRRMRDSE